MKSKNPRAKKKSSPPPILRCKECDKKIQAKDQALFVEEEVGRYFCSEPCIVAHFTPDIEKLEKIYHRHLSAKDLSVEERERYAHLRWMTLEQPDEVWCEVTKTGDHRFTLIAEFKPETQTIWAVSICLMLRGDPSFLYLAFMTNDRYLVDEFRKGQKMPVSRKSPLIGDVVSENGVQEAAISDGDSDRLAEPWTEADSLRASIVGSRGIKDIPENEFKEYQHCLEETLQEPTELWSYPHQGSKKGYHFLRRYDQDQPFWYVVIAKDALDETQIEIVDAFPTNDDAVARLCRHGRKENLKQLEMAGSVPEETVARKNFH